MSTDELALEPITSGEAWTARLRALRKALWRAWRRAVGALRRLHWEFWPPPLAYVPVLAYMGWLGLKHRGPLVWTAANPAMPAGGLIGESKWDILRGLSGCPEHLAKAILVYPAHGAEACLAEARRFMAEHDLRYPVVVKPDVGCRGRGVKVVRSDAAFRAAIRAAGGPVIVQEHVAGREFGVFYYRLPGEQRGHILSVTDKRPATVTGDGKRTLEELILADRRAVCLAHQYLRDNADLLGWVPSVGERVELGEIGSHARGFVFRDGRRLRTPALEAAIDAMSRRYDGFFFGRYDIRTPCVDDFRDGRNFKAIELNGVSSEAIAIYDPALGLRATYRLFFRQWRLAFAIGAANAARGHPPITWRALWRLWRAHRRR